MYSRLNGPFSERNAHRSAYTGLDSHLFCTYPIDNMSYSAVYNYQEIYDTASWSFR
jgi:hypothetical protein